MKGSRGPIPRAGSSCSTRFSLAKNLSNVCLMTYTRPSIRTEPSVLHISRLGPFTTIRFHAGVALPSTGSKPVVPNEVLAQSVVSSCCNIVNMHLRSIEQHQFSLFFLIYKPLALHSLILGVHRHTYIQLIPSHFVSATTSCRMPPITGFLIPLIKQYRQESNSPPPLSFKAFRTSCCRLNHWRRAVCLRIWTEIGQ